MLAPIIKLVTDWRNALAVILLLGLALWIRPDAGGFTALAVVVFALVYLAAAAAKALRPGKPPPPGDPKPPT